MKRLQVHGDGGPDYAWSERGDEGLQVTLYFSDEDAWLIRLVDAKARRERKSRSAVVISILEEYFEKGKRLGEILVDLEAVDPRAIEEALELQKDERGKLVGEILVEKGVVAEEAVEKALEIQSRYR